jgi:hypothetical protein
LIFLIKPIRKLMSGVHWIWHTKLDMTLEDLLWRAHF